MRIRPRLLALAVLVALAVSAGSAATTTASPVAVPAARLRRMPVVPRVCAQAGPAARRALGDRGRRRRDRRDGSSGRCARLRRRGSGLRRRLLGHERPGGGRRRAGSRQDERTHAVRRLGWACELARRALAPAEAPRLAAARVGLHARAAPPRRATFRPLAGLAEPIPVDGGIAIRAPWPYPSRTVLTEIDVTEPARLQSRGRSSSTAGACGAHGGRRGACRPVVAGRGRSPLRPSGRPGAPDARRRRSGTGRSSDRPGRDAGCRATRCAVPRDGSSRAVMSSVGTSAVRRRSPVSAS